MHDRTYVPASAPGRISRRTLLAALPAAALVPRLRAQGVAPIPARTYTYFRLRVADVARSVEFYQGLFGMPVQARQGEAVLLRVGEGPQHLALAPAGADRPAIERFGLGVEGFDPDRTLKALAAHGIMAATGGQMPVTPMQAAIVARAAAQGGVPGGTRELFLRDPAGLLVHLSDPAYCGGGGPLGNTCGTPEPPPKPGPLAVRGYSHLTAFVSDGQRENDFYQTVFGFDIQAYQGPTAPLLGLGDGIQFIMFAGGGGPRGGRAGRGGRGGRGGGTARAGGAAPGAAPAPGGNIHHLCLNMDGFDRDGILATLEKHGVKPREANSQATPPLISYVSTRMPNRGGAPEGTPELYLTDPDGLLIQLQDVKYCGGGGFLGDLCPPLK